LPVVITPNISDDSDIISNNDIGAIISSFDEVCCNAVLAKIEQLLEKNKNGDLSIKIRNIAINYRNFSIAENVYAAVYPLN